MLGVAEWRAHPPGLRSIIALLADRRPAWVVSQDVPTRRPGQFITVDRVGTTEGGRGTYSIPLFVFNCYARDAGSAEELCEQLLAELKSAQFTALGDVQFRDLRIAGGPQHYPDRQIPDLRRWQLSVEFGISHRRK